MWVNINDFSSINDKNECAYLCEFTSQLLVVVTCLPVHSQSEHTRRGRVRQIRQAVGTARSSHLFQSGASPPGGRFALGARRWRAGGEPEARSQDAFGSEQGHNPGTCASVACSRDDTRIDGVTFELYSHAHGHPMVVNSHPSLYPCVSRRRCLSERATLGHSSCIKAPHTHYTNTQGATCSSQQNHSVSRAVLGVFVTANDSRRQYQ